MTGPIDLHIHTTASDGSDTPAQLVENVRAAGLALFSVTDHDTIQGALETEPLVPAGIQFIRGVEFSCVTSAGKCHILGYGYDPAHPALLAALEEGRSLRMEKLQQRLRHLREQFGITLTQEELSWLHSRNSPGKPHLGRILLNRGLAPDLNSAIRTYLKNVPGRDRIEADTAVKAILASGGLPVWAHPLGGEGEKRLTPEAFGMLLTHLIQCGIRGLECRYSRYGPEEIDFLLAQARIHGLASTGGSDYHGTNKEGIALGQLSCDGAAWVPDARELTVLRDML